LPYVVKSSKKVDAIIDSIPEATLFKAAFKRSTIQAYSDSLTSLADTYFIPTDQAFIKAGYTADKLNTMPVGELDQLLGYLIVRGYVNTAQQNPRQGVSYQPLIHPDPTMQGTMPGVFSSGLPYIYVLTVGFSGNNLLLNGKTVKANAVGIRGSNGSVFMIDDIVTKPTDEMYQLLQADTSLTFYMAALQKSNDVYMQKGIAGAVYYNVRFDDIDWLMLNNNYIANGAGALPFAVVFAPVNNAFRKAGFHSISDVEAYIDRSELATTTDYEEILTNMDSILVNHRFLSGFYDNTGYSLNTGWSYLYTTDLLSLKTISNGGNEGAMIFTGSAGKVTMHRQDFPNGRAANIIPVSDITTLNGVVHHVDNLLLPTP
jgi:uncharacterized surface protein with fasciclin (FAS1) repeats